MIHTVSVYRAVPSQGQTIVGVRPVKSVLVRQHKFDGPAVAWGAKPSGNIDGAREAARAEVARLYPSERIQAISADAGGFVVTLAAPRRP